MSSTEIDQSYLQLIVDNLISGMDVNRVPAEYIQYIFEPLAEEKEKAIKIGRVDIVKRIQTVVRQVNSLSAPKKVKKKAKKRTISKIKNREIPENKEESDTLIMQQLRMITNDEYTDINDPEVIQRVIPILKEEKEQAIHEGDYHQAQMIHNLIKQLHSRTLKSALDNFETEQFYQIQNQIADLEDDLQETINYWNEQETLATNALNDEEAEMIELHKQQIIDFKRTWPKELPACYRKVSSRVLQLREQEKHLITSNHFEEALDYRKRADKLERAEIEQQRINFDVEFHRSIMTLKSAQKKELGYMRNKWTNKIDHIKAVAKNEIDGKKRTIQLLKEKLNPTLSTILTKPKTRSVQTNFSPASRDIIASRESRIVASKLAYRSPWRY